VPTEFRETVVWPPSRKARKLRVIINRPTDRSLAEMLPSERFKLSRSRYSSADRWRLSGFSPVFQADGFPARPCPCSRDSRGRAGLVDALLNNPPPKIVFLGLFGWAPGQLRGELDRATASSSMPTPATFFLKDTPGLQDMGEAADPILAPAPMMAPLLLQADDCIRSLNVFPRDKTAELLGGMTRAARRAFVA